MLVAVAYYIGSEKEYNGEFYFALVGYTTAVAMIFSEIVAKTKKTNQTVQNAASGTSQSVIANLIPFTTLNIIFAFSILINAIVKVIQSTQIGVPKLSIQLTAMLLCLLFANSEAVTRARKMLAGLSGNNSVLPTTMAKSQEVSPQTREQRAESPQSLNDMEVPRDNKEFVLTERLSYNLEPFQSSRQGPSKS